MRLTFTFLLAVAWSICTAQTLSKTDSLRRELLTSKHDTSRVQIMLALRSQFDLVSIDSSLMYSQRALNLAQRIQFANGEVRALYNVGSAYRRMGEIPKGLESIYKGLQIAKEKRDSSGLALGYSALGLVHFDLDEYLTAISNFQTALKLNRDESQEVFLLMRIAYAYAKDNQLDLASIYMQKAINKWKTLKLPDSFNALFFELIGEIQFALNNRSLAFDYLQKSIQINQKNNFLLTGAIAHIVIAGFYKEIGQLDSSTWHAKQGLSHAEAYGVKKRILEASSLLAELYESKDLKEALYYRKVYDSTNEKLYGRRKVQELQKILNIEQERQRETELQKIAYQNKLKQYSLLFGLGVIMIIAFLLYRNNRHKQKANVLLQKQKEKIESTLQELKAAQAQLIQSEKMASLGELTAGIAHEIQNPLNFVNNFSEVNKELIDELKSEKSKIKGERDEELENQILIDISQNLEKIAAHGRRADSIVKAMLEHSRTSTGQKEPTDVNALIDEYLRLSYHGLRAKDKSFNATFKTGFDESIGKINVIPQEIGRVFLNLFNNAFYSVNEKKKQLGNEYEPLIHVSTKKLLDKIEIRVKDNGVGIPQRGSDKIFQPFFTTKPTGQGTGLGLSLSYDIIKAHGGELKVETKEGEFAEFIIQLPVT